MTFYETHKKGKRRGKRSKPAVITWLLLLAASVLLYYLVYTFPLSPRLLRIGAAAVLGIILLIMGLVSFSRGRSRKTGACVLNVLLALSMLTGCLFIPAVKDDLEDIFKEPDNTVENRIAVYALTTDYKADHLDVFQKSGHVISYTNLSDYANLQFITQSSVDQENQSFAIDEIKKKLDKDDLWLNETENIWKAVEALYNDEGQALILNTAYVDTIEEEYGSFSEDTFVVDYFTKTEEKEQVKVIDVTKDPFSFFVAGSDSRNARLSRVTRTDVDIICTVNPNTKQIMIVSLPRDSYIENPAVYNGMDKLTHMGIYDITNSLDALSQYLDMDLDKYVLVNFNTYKEIVDALNGVDVNNPYAFSGLGHSFPAGQIHLNGDAALAYVRERYSLANGDFGRNEHQVIVLKAIISKMLSPDVITNFSSLMDALDGTFLTNISTSSIWKLANMQINDMASWDIIQYHVTGDVGSAECVSMPGMLLSVVYPTDSQIQFIKNEIEIMMNNEKTEQKTLPE